MQTDYLPQSPADQLEWFLTQEKELTEALAGQMGATPEERTAYLAAVAEFKAAVKPIVELTELLKGLRAALPGVKKEQLPIIRSFIARAKLSPACDPGMVKRLDWDPITPHIDLETARPRLKVEVQRGGVCVRVKKPGFEQVNVYGRRRGEAEWTLIGENLARFPWMDERPLAVPGTPEVREYMAIGVAGGEEAGQPSEAVEVVFAG